MFKTIRFECLFLLLLCFCLVHCNNELGSDFYEIGETPEGMPGIPEGKSDMDYKVSLYRRKSVKRGKPVYDATLTPIEADSGGVPK